METNFFSDHNLITIDYASGDMTNVSHSITFFTWVKSKVVEPIQVLTSYTQTHHGHVMIIAIDSLRLLYIIAVLVYS